jgi:hypothetical protein
MVDESGVDVAIGGGEIAPVDEVVVVTGDQKDVRV